MNDRAHAVNQLCSAIRQLHANGWAPGTGGNFSAVLSKNPLRLLITPSGADKGAIEPADLLEVDAGGVVIAGAGAASAETLLHVAIVEETGAACVLHTHSVANTVLSRRLELAAELRICGYEMLKGLAGVRTHEHCESVPILSNSQDMPALAGQVRRILGEQPRVHGVLLAGHGLYTWGTSIAEARRHVEIFEFLFEVVKQGG